MAICASPCNNTVKLLGTTSEPPDVVVGYSAKVSKTAPAGGSGVASTLAVQATTNAGTTAQEWAFLTALENYATGGAGVAITGYVNKRSSGNSWGAIIGVTDLYSTTTAVGTSVCLEMDLGANGTDPNSSRVGIDMGVANKGGAFTEWGIGIRLGVQGAAQGSAKMNTGIMLVGAMNTCIDMAGASPSGSAIRLAANQKIFLESSGAKFMQYETASDQIRFIGAMVQMAKSFNVGAAGNTATSASGGSASPLPANPVGYLIIQIGGATQKIPYYAP